MWVVPLFDQYLFGFFLNLPDVFKCEPVPLVNPTAHLAVEFGEDPFLSIHDHLLHSPLEPPPLELAGHQLVRTHDGVCSLLPVLLVRTTASLLRVEQFWVHFFTVVLQRVHGSDLHNTLTH